VHEVTVFVDTKIPVCVRSVVVELGQLLRAERKRRDLTQLDIARALNRSASAIQQKEAGIIPISDDEAREWAQAIGIRHELVMEQVGRSLQRRIPLLDFARAGKLVFESDLQDGTDPKFAEEFVSGTDIATSRAFALRVDGESMVPTIPNRAIIICEPLLEGDEGMLRDGVIVAAWVAPRKKGKGATWEGGGVIGRWFYLRDSNTAELRKDNPEHPKVTLDLSHEATPRIARVIEIRIRP
jgi:transcriptional regulator with XRE-family HTH domain